MPERLIHLQEKAADKDVNMHIDARYQNLPDLSILLSQQAISQREISDTPADQHGRIIGPIGTTLLDTGHDRPPY